ncbi:MAG: hypothetical protein ACI9PN_001301 [Candidatus Azotimanducaceae bacterium]|jgi:hypothetical protein
MHSRFLFLILITLMLPACQEIQTSTVTADFRHQEGVYVVAYTADTPLRKRMEDQLASDLRLKKIIAKTSFSEIQNITQSSPAEVIQKASDAHLLAVLVINQVNASGLDKMAKDPKRISPSHPTLQEFYAYSKQNYGKEIEKDQEVFAEVSLFIINKGEAKLAWSGTTWSFEADNKGTAIRDISDMVASQLATLRDASK